MRKSIHAYHYGDKLKAAFLLTCSLLKSYERSDRRKEIIQSLFDAFQGEVNTAEAVLGKTSTKNQSCWRKLGTLPAPSVATAQTGEMSKIREQIAKAISSVTL